MKHKYLYLISAVLLLFTACALDDDNLVVNHVGTAYGYPSEASVVNISDKVVFDATVEGATSAKVSLVDDEGTLIKVLEEAAPVTDNMLSLEFDPIDLGLEEADNVAYIKVEANGYEFTFVISMTSSWAAPIKNKKFTALEGKTINDTITFTLRVNDWMDAAAVNWTKYYTVNSGSVQTAITLTNDAKKPDTKKMYIFNSAALQAAGVNVNDTVNVVVIANYSGKTDTVRSSFVIATDKCTSVSAYAFTADNLVSTTNKASFNAVDSTQKFYGLLSKEEFEGVEDAMDAQESEPVLVLSGSPFKIQNLSDTCKVEYVASTKNDFKANSRVTAESAFGGTPTLVDVTSTGATATQYYMVKITVGVNRVNPTYYFGHLIVDWSYPNGTFSNAAYTLNYATKRNYTKE